MEKEKKKEVILCIAWKCVECKSILGYTNAHKDQLRIKYKDLYVFIKGGQTTVICRSCGCQNTVSYTE
jgi:gamma-glutamylcysteine synthetase